MNQPIPLIEDKEENSNQKLSPLDPLFKSLEICEKPEEKLRTCIDFMRQSLSQTGIPFFKGFWDIRKICLPIFKEQLPPPLRAQLWDEYIDLTREGRRLKNLLDEETAFAVEQIELAITVLEKEVQDFSDNYESLLEKISSFIFPDQPKALEGRYPFYQQCQQKLNILNVFASRINGLRKELIKTDMRIRQKNKFFQRLSILGDRVFPIRKTFIKEISDAFINDINAFVENYFSQQNFSHEEIRRYVFFYREEIKTLQSLAKLFTLNTHAFSMTRELLSQCWDKLKGMEKELKKEFANQKQKSSENVEQVKQKIQEIADLYQQGSLSPQEGHIELDKVGYWMRDLELTRYDVRLLKDAIKDVRNPIDEKLNQEVEERRQKDAQVEKERQDRVEIFKQKIELFDQQIMSMEIEEATQQLEQFRKQLQDFSISKTEKQHLDRVLKKIREQISEKKESALLALSDDDRAVLENLQSALDQRMQRRKEVKSQIEEYRKIMGGSGLDFEKAMKYNELILVEKESLEKIDEKILELEGKIKSLKSSLS